MKYCVHCGRQIADEAEYCIYCGRAVARTVYSAQDSGSAGWGFLGFFFPIIGLILYLVWKDERPKTARMAGKGALIGVIVGVVFFIVYIIIMVALLSMYGNVAYTVLPAMLT